jgi:SHAQKYF class myb-like DNA-binding protein
MDSVACTKHATRVPPKSVLELMDVKDLTLENVKNHLQVHPTSTIADEK